MKLRTNVPMQTEGGGKWHPAGSVVEVSNDDGLKLISSNAATPLDAGDDIPSGDNEKHGLSKEELDAAIKELVEVNGVTKKNVTAIIDAGYTTIVELKAATEEQLTAIDGIAAATAGKIVKDAAEFVDEDDTEDEGSDQ